MTFLDEVLTELRQLMQNDKIIRHGDRQYYDVDYIRNHIFYLYRKAIKHVITRYKHKLDRRRIHELNWMCIRALQSMLNYPQSKQFWDNIIEQLIGEISIHPSLVLLGMGGKQKLITFGMT